MATMFCALCSRPVEAKRQIGAGTIILAVITGGLWLLTIPFYAKRCSICKSTAVSVPGRAPIGRSDPALARLAGLEHRLSITEGELETTRDQLDRLRTERDFYRELLGDRAHEKDPPVR
ncbi:MAG: hypothetical protein ACRELT_05505 [Longimicrobiales bacterium]